MSKKENSIAEWSTHIFKINSWLFCISQWLRCLLQLQIHFFKASESCHTHCIAYSKKIL